MNAGWNETHHDCNERHTIVKARAVVDRVWADGDHKDAGGDNEWGHPPDGADHVILDSVSECPLKCPDGDSDDGTSNAVGDRVHATVETAIDDGNGVDDES